MKKRIIAALLTAAIAVTSITGCGSGSSSDSAPAAGTDSGEAAGEEGSGNSEVEGEVEEIVFAYMTNNNIPETSELERIENLLNEYTVEKINTKVDLVLYSNSDYMNQVNLMLTSGEQVDIFRTNGTPFLPYIEDGTALDITDYLGNELKETTEILYDGLLKPTTVEGRTYGLMSMGSNYVPGGFAYREDIVEELGIDMSQVDSPEDLTAVFEQVKAAYPDMIILDPNRASTLFETYLGKIVEIDPIGDNIGYPVSGVAYQTDPTVVNMYETQDFRDICEFARDWYEKGYYSSDAATTTATSAELLMSGNCFGTFCGLGNPQIAKQYTTNYGYPFANVKISDSLVWSGNTDAWMVNSRTKAPSAACKFLNLLYTDEYVDNLLIYGEEGVDYELNEDGCVIAPEGYEDLNSVAYTNNMNYYLWGNKWLAYPVVGGLSGEEKEKNMEDNYAGRISNYYGFLWDYGSLEAEYTACANIVEEYKRALWVGAVDVEETLAEMNERLYAAGLDKLMAEKQAQLDEWISNQE